MSDQQLSHTRAGQSEGGGGPAPLDSLCPLVARVARRPAEQLGADTRFEEIGSWGSLSAMRLLAVVEQTYGVQLDLRTYMKFGTIGELAGEIGRLRGGAAVEAPTAPTG
ncbi:MULTISPECIES: acyl carrier protein [unclassified Streptomyces]|uniref:acyl carrier protein n=1 Tax=unclassified Streptomyces TaxID=2593676 RepID=UPI00382A1727